MGFITWFLLEPLLLRSVFVELPPMPERCAIWWPHKRQTQIGIAALITASQYGHTDCVRLLLEGGADKDAITLVREADFNGSIFCFIMGCSLSNLMVKYQQQHK